MFIDFFYSLRENGLPASPTAFLTLNRALAAGLIENINDFYIGARSILLKSERYFDRYDQVFAHYFAGTPFPPAPESILDDTARQMLSLWLQNPGAAARLLGLDEAALQRLSREELLDYFREMLQEQKGEHHGGSRWIGTSGSAPLGHAGCHPTGLRLAGESTHLSALQTAGRRRYREYTREGPLTVGLMGEALKKLKKLGPAGAKDRLNIGATITRTVQLGGEIEIVFEQGLKDRVKVILAIDNGGWSMDPHVKIVQTLFTYARAQFKDLKIFYFHNTIYDTLWQDHTRSKKPFSIDDFSGFDPETRFIVLGDADMAPFELTSRDGSIYISQRSSRTSLDCLHLLAATFTHAAWFNPVGEKMWDSSKSTTMIRQIFPMFELSLDGLEKAVRYLAA